MNANALARFLRDVFAQPVENLGDVAPRLLAGPAPDDAEVRMAAASSAPGPQSANASPAAPAGPGCYAPSLSPRDNTYLNNYYGPAAAKAAAYGVNPAFVLGNGYESGFGMSRIYRDTGDAFGMTNGTPDRKKQVHASSPQADIDKLFDLYGNQIRGTGDNRNAYLNALRGMDPAGNPVPGWRDYNSTNHDWRGDITKGIGQMVRDVPVYRKYCAPNPQGDKK